MVTPTIKEGELNKLGRTGITLLSSLIFISFIPLCLQAFMDINPNAVNEEIINRFAAFFQVSSAFISIVVLALAFCISRRGINKPELILCIVYGFLGPVMLAYFMINVPLPPFLSTCRLTIEYLTPILIANHLGIFGRKSGRRSKAIAIILPVISLIIISLAAVVPMETTSAAITVIPVQNPYDLLPLTLVLTASFLVYPRLVQNYASYTLHAYWAATIPTICAIILTLFSPLEGSPYMVISNLLYIFLSRCIILSGILGDTFRREQAFSSLEGQLVSKEGRVRKYKMAYREKEQLICDMTIDFAEKEFYCNAFSMVYDTVQSLVLLLTPNGKVISANPYTRHLLALPDKLNDGSVDINDIISTANALDTCLTLLDKEPEATSQLTFRNLESHTPVKLTTMLSASYERNSQTEISCIAIIAADTRIQHSLKDENLRLAWQMSIIPSPIIEFSENGMITYLNDEAREYTPDSLNSGWQHPLLRNIKSSLPDLQAGKQAKVERKILCNKRYFQQTVTYNKLFKRFALHAMDITESGKKLAENEKVVNYAAWLQQQFCIHYTEPYQLLAIMLKKSVEWLEMEEAVICTENNGILTRIASFPETNTRSGRKDPHSDLLTQMLTSVPTGPFEIPTADDDSQQPSMGYHLNVNERAWGVLYFVGSSTSVERGLRQNILGNIGSWLTMVISQTSTADIATRHYYLSPAPMFTCLADGQLTRANTAFEKIFEIHENDVAQCSVGQLLSRTETRQLSDILTIPTGSWMTESIIKLNIPGASNSPFRLMCAADPLTEILFCLLIPQASGLANHASVHEGMARIGKEISPPLNCVVGMTELLESSGLGLRQKNFVEQIRQSAEMLIGLSDTIHDYSLLRSGELELSVVQFDMQNLLEQIFSAFENEAASKSVSMFLHYHPQTPRCFWGDRERIGSILRNLIGNAVRFTDIGHVSVIIHDSSKGDRHAHTVEITIEDSGAGIPKDQLEALFIEHTPASPGQHYSLGLGLTTAKELAGMMNGDITVKSTLGHGTTFSLSLQIQPAPLLRESQTTICELNIHKAMLIMGDPLVMQVISETLDDATLECDTYTEPVAALKAIDLAVENGAPYRLVIVDEEIRNPSLHSFAEIIKRHPEHDDLILIKCSLDGYRSPNEIDTKFFQETIHSPITPVRVLKVLSRVFAPDDADHPRHTMIPEDTVNLKRSISILIADSDPMNRDIMSGLMEKSAAVIDISADGARAVELACRHKYDLIFMSVNLPGMDGLEATRAIRKVEAGKRHTPIIAILNTDDPKIKRKGRLAGMDGYLAKPVRRRNLNRILHEFIIDATIINSVQMTSLTETVDLYPLEIEKAAHEMGVKKKLYVRIIRMFCDSLGEHLNLVSEAFEKHDARNLSLSARKLGRSAANLHLYELKNVCLKLEEMADSGEWENLRSQIDVLQQHTHHLQDFAENLPS